MQGVRSNTILLVEDDEDDVFLIRRACETAGIAGEITSAENGKAAVTFLEALSASPGAAQKSPEFIFLDLNMPVMNGLDFLRWLRSQARWRKLPVLVLTTSEDPRDISAAYELGANAYLVKPNSLADFAEMLRAVGSFWLRFNRSPQTADRAGGQAS
jgi:two-component system, response regulator